MNEPPLGPSDIPQLYECLKAALSQDQHRQKQAEATLESLGNRRGFTSCLGVSITLLLAVVVAQLNGMQLKMACPCRKSLAISHWITVPGGSPLSTSRIISTDTGDFEQAKGEIRAFLLHAYSLLKIITCPF